MGREKGEGEDSGKLRGRGWVGWRKGGYGSREVNILIKGAILGFARLDSRGISRSKESIPYGPGQRI